MKTEILSQSQSKLQYQHDLASDIIDRKNARLSSPSTLSNKILRDDLIENKIRSMNESTVPRNLFTLLKFDIKVLINPSSIKRSALTRIYVTQNGVFYSLTTKLELEDHLLLRNTKAYWASDTTPFVHTSLGRHPGDTGDSPLAESIFGESFTHTDPAISKFTSNLHRRPSLPNILPVKISEGIYSHAFGGLREKSSAPPMAYTMLITCVWFQSYTTALQTQSE
jgi:hypothetical protein